MQTDSTVELVNKYGFVLVFSTITLLLLIWLVKLLINRLVEENKAKEKILINQLIEENKAKDKIIGNHLDHMTTSLNATIDRMDGMGKDNKTALERICTGLDAGFDKVVGTYQVGIDRQSQLLERVVDKLLSDQGVPKPAVEPKVEEPKI